MTNTTQFSDSMGTLHVPEGALWQAQTQRAVENFPISGTRMPKALVSALINIKLAAAKANQSLGLLDAERANAIEQSCLSLLESDFMNQFPVDVFQTGSGTSTNMNANEVIATLASQSGSLNVHPNDHVNMGQSSNDTIPSAIHVAAAMTLVYELLPALSHLSQTLSSKAEQVGHIVKTGRTHLMDAMPVTFNQTLKTWQYQIDAVKQQLVHQLESVTLLAQGGTAVGTGVNAHPKFADTFSQHLSENLGIRFHPAPSFFAVIGSQDAMASLSGQLKTLATALMKIANDLRWMNSGPLTGLAEIELQPLQPGSSIMPGKVNPVIPEATAMVAAQVMGNDTTITIAAQSGNFELNVMLPVIAHNILQSIELMANTSRLLADKAIATFTVCEDNIQAALSKNPILVTALNPIIGYERAAFIAKTAYAEKRPILDVALEHCDIPREQLSSLLDPAKLTQGGL
jgi:fumarate hydratase class II